MKTITTSNTTRIPAALELILRPARHSLYKARWNIRHLPGRALRTVRTDIRRIRQSLLFARPEYRNLYSEMVRIAGPYSDCWQTEPEELIYHVFTALCPILGREFLDECYADACDITYYMEQTKSIDPEIISKERFAMDVLRIVDAFLYERRAWDENDIAEVLQEGFGIDWASAMDAGYYLSWGLYGMLHPENPEDF